MKRLFDFIFSLFGLIILFIPFLVMACWIVLDSKGGAFFGQKRVGKDGKPFTLCKFRTMRVDSERLGKITVGKRDPRVTRAGYVLRKYKLDELPQLWNVLTGDMSLVGPRPEVPEYVSLYTDDQKKVLSVKPGITDYASLLYYKESELLAQATDPHATYVNEVMPAKLALNLEYIQNRSFAGDIRIILKTVVRMVKG